MRYTDTKHLSIGTAPKDLLHKAAAIISMPNDQFDL